MGANTKAQDVNHDACFDKEVRASRSARKTQRFYVIELNESPSQLSLGPSDIQPIQILPTKHGR